MVTLSKTEHRKPYAGVVNTANNNRSNNKTMEQTNFLATCDEAIAAFDRMEVELGRIRHRINYVEQELDRLDEMERQEYEKTSSPSVVSRTFNRLFSTYRPTA